MKALVTGAAGFIGFHLAARLLRAGYEVHGIDSLDPYYSVELKKDRLKQLELLPEAKNFHFEQMDMAVAADLDYLFDKNDFTYVLNMAAQAGVRYSLEKPAAYVRSNLDGFGNLLECCRRHKTGHLVFASSSSVYGLNAARPYSTHQNADHPISIYAATKKGGELMAHSYSHLFELPCTGLRFFTVYGPWGRPDMALYLFTTAILDDKPIKVFNRGLSRRDFTYIDDVVEGVFRIMEKPAQPDPDFDPAAPDPASSTAPWRIYNIGNNSTVPLGEFIEEIESALGKKAIKEMLPMQPGDVESTWADVRELEMATGFRPATPLRKGIAEYVKWYRNYYGR